MEATRDTTLQTVGEAYIAYCRHRLSEEYLSKIKSCLDKLSDDDIWWRAHETDNSIGNLLLHLSGNIRQWIISGLGGMDSVRDRKQEFAERTHIPKNELLQKFELTIQEADQVLARFNSEKLLEVRHIQIGDVTCLDALSHVVEHVAQHTGQIIYITKLRKAVDLKFYNL